jgi:hypothetical protein
MNRRVVVIETVRSIVEPDRGWLYDYQTLLTGLLAVLAAAAAWWSTNGQLRAMKQDRNGRMRAARAVLPATLSGLCDYAEGVVRALRSLLPAEARLYPEMINLFADFHGVGVVPKLAPELIQPLERMVELTPVKEVAEQIEAILREAQVLDARTRGFDVGTSLSYHEWAGRIVDAAALYARAESLFPFARRQTDKFALGDLWPRVGAALTIFGVRERWILEVAEEQRTAGLPPGEANTPDVG